MFVYAVLEAGTRYFLGQWKSVAPSSHYSDVQFPTHSSDSSGTIFVYVMITFFQYVF